MDGGEIFVGIFDPVLAQVVEVGGGLDGDGAILAGRDVEEAQVGGLLLDDLAFGERGGLDVEALVLGVLL